MHLFHRFSKYPIEISRGILVTKRATPLGHTGTAMAYQLPDFDTLMELAEKDPAAFDQLKAEAVEDTISSASADSQRRLRGLQWQVDVELKKAKTPMEGCVKVSEMMHDSLWELRMVLENHDAGLIDEFFHDAELDATADIIPLKR